MDRCPRCGAQVPLTLGQCPRCGLSRGDSPTSPPGSQVAQRPRSGERSGLVTASLVLVLVVALLAVGGLWVAGAGPFSSNPRPAAQPTPGAPVTVTVTPTQPPTTAVPSAPTPTTTPSSTPSASSLSQVYAQVQSGVGLVGVTTCDGAFTGTGFLVDANTMVTAEHVVDGATTVQVRFGRTWSPATVIGVAAADDLALLSLPTQVGHTFTVASDDPGPGTSIAAIGFPLGGPKSLSQGTISGLGRTITTDSGTFRGLLQTDTAINPGNSGGPLIDATGQVVGVADAIRLNSQGIGYAVAASKVAAVVESTETLTPLPPPPCERQPSAEAAVSQALLSYLNAINTGDYDGAMSYLAPSLRTSRAQWLHDYATSYDTGLHVISVAASGYTAHAWATFTSHQDPGYGPSGARQATCVNWSLDYDLSRVEGGRWIITGASGHAAQPSTVC